MRQIIVFYIQIYIKISCFFGMFKDVYHGYFILQDQHDDKNPRCVMDMFLSAMAHEVCCPDVKITKKDVRSILIDLIVSGPC